MRWWRIAWRAPAALAWSAGGAVAVVGALWVGGAERGWRWRCAAYRLWARGVCRILGVRLTVEGVAPAPPFLLVSNHLGYLDIPVLSSVLDGSFVAKSEVARWPFFGWIARAGGTIFVRRGTRQDVVRVAAEIRRELDAGHGVFLFPEGTSSDGSGVARFHSPLLAAAVEPPRAVSCAALSYATVAGDPPPESAVCWWGGAPLLPHLWGLLGLARIEARLRFGDGGVREFERKLLSRRLHEAVRELAASAETSEGGVP